MDRLPLPPAPDELPGDDEAEVREGMRRLAGLRAAEGDISELSPPVNPTTPQ